MCQHRYECTEIYERYQIYNSGCNPEVERSPSCHQGNIYNVSTWRTSNYHEVQTWSRRCSCNCFIERHDWEESLYYVCQCHVALQFANSAAPTQRAKYFIPRQLLLYFDCQIVWYTVSCSRSLESQPNSPVLLKCGLYITHSMDVNNRMRKVKSC